MKFSYIILLFFASYCCAQNNIYTKHYTPIDGLASSETYFLITDSKGFLWIGTDRGLNKFDGKTFTTYTTANGLGTNFVDRVFINPHNQQIWVRCLDKKLYYFNNELFLPYKQNETLRNILLKNQDDLQQIYFNEDGSLNIFTKLNGLLVEKNNNLTAITQQSASYIKLVLNNTLQIPYGIKNHNVAAGYIEFLNKKFNYTSEGALGYGPLLSLKQKNGKVLVSFNNILCEVEDNKIVNTITFKNTILCLYEDQLNNLWISCNEANGIYKYAPNIFPTASNGKLYFNKYLVTSIVQDLEKNYWISTHDDGLFFAPDLAIVEIDIPVNTKEKEITNRIEASKNGTIFAGTNKYKIHWLKNNSWSSLICKYYLPSFKKLVPFTNNSNICNSLYFDEGLNKIFFAMPNTGSINMSTLLQDKNTYTYGFNINMVAPGILVTASQDAVIINKLTSNTSVSVASTERTYSSLYFNNNIWVGAESGLYKLVNPLGNSNNTLVSYAGFTKKTRVTDLALIATNTLVAATLGEGIFITNGVDNKFLSLTDPLLTGQNGYNMVNDIEVVNDTVFAATQNGVVWFNANHPSPTLHYISNKTGLILNDVKSISFSNNHLYILHQNKIIDIDFINYQKTINNIPVFINKIFVNDSLITNFKNKVALEQDNNKLKIYFSPLSFKSGTQIYFQYRLLNNQNQADTLWQITQSSVLEFSTLRAGKYILQVRAINENNAPSTFLSEFNFEVLAPFYYKGWFITSLIILLVLLMYLLNHLRLKRIEKQNKLQEQLLKYEQQALAAQINPHFIFNSLNSIQSFVLKKDERQTLKYITQFSRLMRLSLDNIRAKWVIPQAEIDLIKVYLELEKLRFGEKFDFEIEIDSLLKTNKYLIAPMLAQPFIENAIKHGVNNLSNRKGLIAVRAILKLPEKHVLIQIEDNGVGRVLAAERESKFTKNHLSAGLDITINRIKLLCYETNRPFYFKIIDKPNNQGTIVEYYLPHKTNINTTQ